MDARVPPNNKELESALLGILMVYQGTVTKVINELRSEDFYVPIYAKMYETICLLHHKGHATDVLSVVEQLVSEKSNIEPYEVTKTTLKVLGPEPAETYAVNIKEKSLLRKVIKLTMEINNAAYDETNEARKVLGNLLSQTSAILQEQQGKNVELFQDVIVRAIKQMQDASVREGNLIGIPSSIPALSKLTLGYVAPDLTILAAGTSEGKSTFMLNEAKKAAKEGKNVAIFSLEMANVQLVLKIFNDELNIDMVRLRTGKLEEWEWQELYQKIVVGLSHLNIFMYDIGGLSILEFQTIIKQLKAKHGDDFIVFLDYLQLMTTTGVQEKFSNREGQISYISRQLKGTCKNENIPIVALSQLKRITEKRMYNKSDLRESGAIEQDADKIFFIYRPHYHKIYADEDGKPYTEEDAFIQVEKERLGETGVIPVRFNGRFSRFEDKSTPVTSLKKIDNVYEQMGGF
jgi:replicative DNA helicase